MNRCTMGLVCGFWLAGVFCASAAGSPPTPKKPESNPSITIPWERLDGRTAQAVKQMLEKPTLAAKGPLDTFSCTPDQYYWLLDNPDRAVTAWRRLGAKCVTIVKRAPGRFSYVDDAGSELTWETIHKGPGIRIFLAEGKVKASNVLPLVPVKAMLILRHTESKNADGITVIQHHSEIVIHTDSRAAAALTKMMGQSASKLAEQGLGQIQIFFSALSCFMDRHPERVELLFKQDT